MDDLIRKELQRIADALESIDKKLRPEGQDIKELAAVVQESLSKSLSRKSE